MSSPSSALLSAPVPPNIAPPLSPNALSPNALNPSHITTQVAGFLSLGDVTSLATASVKGGERGDNKPSNKTGTSLIDSLSAIFGNTDSGDGNHGDESNTGSIYTTPLNTNYDARSDPQGRERDSLNPNPLERDLLEVMEMGLSSDPVPLLLPTPTHSPERTPSWGSTLTTASSAHPITPLGSPINGFQSYLDPTTFHAIAPINTIGLRSATHPSTVLLRNVIIRLTSSIPLSLLLQLVNQVSHTSYLTTRAGVVITGKLIKHTIVTLLNAATDILNYLSTLRLKDLINLLRRIKGKTVDYVVAPIRSVVQKRYTEALEAVDSGKKSASIAIHYLAGTAEYRAADMNGQGSRRRGSHNGQHHGTSEAMLRRLDKINKTSKVSWRAGGRRYARGRGGTSVHAIPGVHVVRESRRAYLSASERDAYQRPMRRAL